MEKQGVIFDLGHTLMHLHSTWAEVTDNGIADLSAYLEAEGLELDGLAFGHALVGRRAEGYARVKETLREVTAEESMRWTFAKFGIPHPDRQLLAGSLEAFFSYEGRCWDADPEALPVLQELERGGRRLSMFSNATDDLFIQGLVDRFGFRPLLDPSLTSAGTGVRKPDPLAFAPILESWQMAPEKVVMIGDTLDADILGARQAGMRSVWIHAREDARQEGAAAAPQNVANPDAEIDHLGELPRVLDRLR